MTSLLTPDIAVELIEAPLAVETSWSGVSLMAEALRHAGLAERLNARPGARLPEADWVQNRDPATGLISPHETAAWNLVLAKAVQECLDAGRFPLVVGGDCTILLGCLLAQKRNGGGGLLFVDGHADFYLPGQSPSGETADMDLALAVGLGPDILANLGGAKPLVDAGSVVAFGGRDRHISQLLGAADPAAHGILDLNLEAIRLKGFNNACESILERLLDGGERFWLHVDLDVLDDRVMPAVDYRMPGGGGLSAGELVALLRRVLASGRVSGMDLTIFNPTLDWDGSLSELIVEMLGAVFSVFSTSAD